MKKILFTLFVLGAFVLRAQETDREFKAETIELIEITSSTVFKDVVSQASATIPAENVQAFKEEVESSLKGLLSNIADVYMQEFTHNEIKEILAFYETPTGKKMANKTGLIMKKSMAIGQSWGGELHQLVQKYSN